MTATGAPPDEPEPGGVVPGGPTPAGPLVATLCREYAALTAAAAVGLADFLDDVAALALRLLPTARSARIRVHDPEVVTVVADAPGVRDTGPGDVLAIPLVGRGDLTGMLELAAAGDGFPVHERELAEVLAVLLTLTLGPGRAA